MPDWNAISNHIKTTCGESLDPNSAQPVSGGCINAAYRLQTDSRQVFIKINSAHNLQMFEAESDGLTELAKSHSIRVPQPLCCGIAGNESYLVMEDLQLRDSAGNPKLLGENLAALHQVTALHNGLPRFGWFRDNTIGSTPQINDYEDNWQTFWSKHRLGYQLTLAQRNGAGNHALQKMVQRGKELCETLDGFFVGYTPVASLLHGDLWSGNFSYDQTNSPVIFDPAVYYGDRETDLAMTELFGGFPTDFYAAYKAANPLDEGYATRKTLYNLYHILNHYNLFGGGYLSQASGMIDRLLSELH